MKNHLAARIALFLFAASLFAVVMTGCPEWFTKTWSLTVGATPSAGGTVAKNPSRSSYDDGAVVTLTPAAANGYRFDHWSGDLSGSANPGSVTMDEDMTVTAVFVESISQTVSDAALNLAGDTSKTYLDLLEVSIVLEGGQYRFTANTAAAFPDPATMTSGARIDIIFWVDIDNNTTTSQFPDGKGNDYNIHICLHDEAWQHNFYKVSDAPQGTVPTYVADDFTATASGSSAVLTFPAKYLPSDEFAWRVTSSTGNWSNPDQNPDTDNLATTRTTFQTSVLP